MKSLSAFNLTIHHLYSKYTLCDQCLNYVLQQFKFKTCLELWVYSLSDPFKLQTTSLLLLLSLIQNLQCTTNQQCNILSGSTLMVPEASQSMLPASALIWQLQCPHYLNIAITILEYWRCRHLRTAVLLFWSVLLFLLVCVTHKFFDLKPVRAFAFWIPVEMYRGPTSTTSVNFCYNFKPDGAGIVNFKITAI